MPSFKMTWNQDRPAGSARIKAFTDKDGILNGDVEFYASVFGNVDYMGDVVHKGAFTDSLAELRKSGDPIPLIFAHDWGSIGSILGSANAKDCVEDDFGLLIRGHIDMEHPDPKRVAYLMHRKVLREASFAFDVGPNGERHGTKDDLPDSFNGKSTAEANHLVRLNILEVGPCLKGANMLAGRPFVKGMEAFAGFKQILEGSREELTAALQYAAAEKFGSDDDYLYVEGTFPDYAVFCVTSMGSSEAPKYLKVPYTLDGEDVTLGAAVEVELETTVTEDSAAEDAAEAATKAMDAAGATSETNSPAKPDEPGTGNGVVAPDRRTGKRPNKRTPKAVTPTLTEVLAPLVERANFFHAMGDTDGELIALARVQKARVKYSEDQERDENGRFGSGGGDGSSEPTAQEAHDAVDTSPNANLSHEGSTEPDPAYPNDPDLQEAFDRLNLGDRDEAELQNMIDNEALNMTELEAVNNELSLIQGGAENTDDTAAAETRAGPGMTYDDARGVSHTGVVENVVDSGGHDVTYFMRSEEGDLHVISGSVLETLRPTNEVATVRTGPKKDIKPDGTKEGEVETKDAGDCETCDGTGKIRDGHMDCPDCGGTGKLKTKDTGDCPDCDGTGRVNGVKCEACGGTGKMEETSAEKKSASADTDGEDVVTKDEEPDTAKSEESDVRTKEQVLADIADMEQFLRS